MGVGGTGVDRDAAPEIEERRIRVSQALLGDPGGGDQGLVGRRSPESGAVLLQGLAEIPDDVVVVLAQREVGLGSTRSRRRGVLGRRERGPGIARTGGPIVVQDGMRPRELRPRGREAGVEGHRPLVVSDRLPQLARVCVAQPGTDLLTLQEGIVRREVLGRLLRQRLPLPRAQGHVERLGHAPRDVRLHLEHVRDRRVERLLPPRRAGRDLDQLRAHLDAARAGRVLLPADLPHDEILDPELLADLLRRFGGVLVLARAVGRDHLESREPGELAAHRVGHSVGEVLLVRAAHVVERQDRDQLGPLPGVLDGAVGPLPDEHSHRGGDQEPEHERDGRIHHAAADGRGPRPVRPAR